MISAPTLANTVVFTMSSASMLANNVGFTLNSASRLANTVVFTMSSASLLADDVGFTMNSASRLANTVVFTTISASTLTNANVFAMISASNLVCLIKRKQMVGTTFFKRRMPQLRGRKGFQANLCAYNSGSLWTQTVRKRFPVSPAFPPDTFQAEPPDIKSTLPYEYDSVTFAALLQTLTT